MGTVERAETGIYYGKRWLLQIAIERTTELLFLHLNNGASNVFLRLIKILPNVNDFYYVLIMGHVWSLNFTQVQAQL
jgi:hypothetical protein